MRFVVLAACLFSFAVRADEVLVAVASNFLSTAHSLKQNFEQQSSHTVKISSGSTGKLYTQIRNGAPFDLFLAANSAEPEKLDAAGFIVAGTRKTYANGVLVLAGKATADAPSASMALSLLEKGTVALPNPKLAPYGQAALEVLKGWSLDSSIKIRLVYAENVSQSLAYLISGGAGYAFVARSQMLALEADYQLRMWEIAEASYTPIRQQVVLLKRAKENPAAIAFYEFLFSDAAQKIIREAGYSSS